MKYCIHDTSIRKIEGKNSIWYQQSVIEPTLKLIQATCWCHLGQFLEDLVSVCAQTVLRKVDTNFRTQYNHLLLTQWVSYIQWNYQFIRVRPIFDLFVTIIMTTSSVHNASKFLSVFFRKRHCVWFSCMICVTFDSITSKDGNSPIYRFLSFNEFYIIIICNCISLELFDY